MHWLLPIVITLAWWATPQSHPHDENPIVRLSGTLVNVDLKTQTIQIAAFDRETKSTRTLVLFVDPKIKLRQGKRRLALSDLIAGQRVTCTAERELDRDSRLVVFEISVDERSK